MGSSQNESALVSLNTRCPALTELLQLGDSYGGRVFQIRRRVFKGPYNKDYRILGYVIDPPLFRETTFSNMFVVYCDPFMSDLVILRVYSKRSFQ